MRPPSAHTTSTNLASFWRNYVHIGVLTYSMGALVVVVYALTTPVSHRVALVVLGCLSLAASVGPFRWLGLRLVATRWSKAFFTSWAACTFVFIATGSVLDGGVRSPFVYFLVLPMLFAGLAFSAGTVLLLGAFGVVTTLVVGILTPNPSWSTTAFLALAVVIAGVITAAAALNRDHLMGRLMDAANLDALTGCLSRGAFQDRLEHESRLDATPAGPVQPDRGRPRQPQVAQRRRWPSFRRPRAADAGRGAHAGGPAGPTWSGAWAATSSPCCCPTPTRQPRWPWRAG